jgi:uncharacterized membrane protein
MAQRPNFKHVLRIRRHQPTRLEGFVDASFAFSVTLIVISIGHVPASVPEMLHALRGLPTFAVCFLLITRFWVAHRDWSRHYDLEDATGTALSLLLVFLVLIYVYPLRLLFSLLFAGISAGVLMEQALELNSIWELRAAFVIYGLGFLAIALVFYFLFRHALKRSADIGLAAAEQVVTELRANLWLATAAIAGLSITLALLLPIEAFNTPTSSLPGLVYALLFIVRPLLHRMYARRLAALPAATKLP